MPPTYRRRVSDAIAKPPPATDTSNNSLDLPTLQGMAAFQILQYADSLSSAVAACTSSPGPGINTLASHRWVAIILDNT
ncbi:hypothetical protein F2Q69_00025307 [Brassica cretica]|uniref:Uncharacterized protein n=1 Tax=Brassica cretica TaxID=69181 RepID=A0A8S9QIC7_BRACR|nr:hypothetical protein F2Q69_00025307 [Brassica cretica]